MSRWMIPCVLSLFAGFFAVMLIWVFWPLGEEQHTLKIPTARMMLDSAAGGAASPALRAPRRVTAHIPSRLRLGEMGKVRLEFAISGPADVSIPDLYATHSVLAEARLELSGVSISPNIVIGQSLLDGEDLDFEWQVTPQFSGLNEGTLWLTLYFVPLDGSAPIERLLSAQRFEIPTASFLGLRQAEAKGIGFVGLGGCLLGLGFAVLRRPKKRH